MTTPFQLCARFAVNTVLRRPPGAGIPVEPADHGLSLRDDTCRERARGVFSSFFAGVDTGVRGWPPVPESLGVETLFHPFFHEGAAMGRSAARVLTLRGHLSLEKGTFSPDEPYAILRVIGAGFLMSFLRPRSPRALGPVAARFGNHGPLVHDGFGFGLGLFRWRGTIGETVRGLGDLEGFERSSALNGLGRSLWFRYMDRPEEAIEVVRDEPGRPALLGGFGLAAAFTFPDDFERAYDVADSLDSGAREAFVKGMRIALFVRHRDQAGFLEERVAQQSGHIRERIHSDLAVALVAHESTHREPRYIERFHEACLSAR